MTRLPVQRTRLEKLQSRLGTAAVGLMSRSWRIGSFALLALLAGFYGGQNLSGFLLFRFPGGRPTVVLILVLGCEVAIRLRGRLVRGEPPLGWVLADNLRIGFVYAVALEAFKLGT